MKIFQVGERNGLEALVAADKADPTAMPGQAIVAPRLVTLISRDLQFLRGTYGDQQPADRVPVSEGVGEVISVGEGVTQVKPGDRVVCGHFCSWIEGAFRPDIFDIDVGITRDGWLAEKVSLPADALIRVPETLSNKDVAGLASAGLTAWNALLGMCSIKAGDLVLCLGTGGVALAAMKIAKAHGARVAITSSSDEKLSVARGLGADITVNYRSHPDWAAEFLRLTGNKGADIIMETGGQDTLAQSMAAAAINGQIVIVGVSPGSTPAVSDYVSFIRKNITIRGIANGNRAMFADLLKATDAAKIETVVSKTFAFNEAPEAFAYFAAAQHVGRVMIEF